MHKNAETIIINLTFGTIQLLFWIELHIKAFFQRNQVFFRLLLEMASEKVKHILLLSKMKEYYQKSSFRYSSWKSKVRDGTCISLGHFLNSTLMNRPTYPQPLFQCRAHSDLGSICSCTPDMFENRCRVVFRYAECFWNKKHLQSFQTVEECFVKQKQKSSILVGFYQVHTLGYGLLIMNLNILTFHSERLILK